MGSPKSLSKAVHGKNKKSLIGSVKREGRKRIYTDQEKYIVLAAVELNGGNVYRTAISFGIPPSTVKDWYEEAKAKPEEFVIPVREKRGNLADKMEDVVHTIVESITPDVISSATLSQRAVAGGIFIDKIGKVRAQGLEPDPDAELCKLLGLNKGELPEHIDPKELGPVIDLSPEPSQVGTTEDGRPLFFHNGQLFTRSQAGELEPFTPEPTYSSIPDPLNQPDLGESSCPPMNCSITGIPCSQTLTWLSANSPKPVEICSDCVILQKDPQLAHKFVAEPSHHSPTCPISSGQPCYCGLAVSISHKLQADPFVTFSCNSCNYEETIPILDSFNRQPIPCTNCFKGVVSPPVAEPLFPHQTPARDGELTYVSQSSDQIYVCSNCQAQAGSSTDLSGIPCDYCHSGTFSKLNTGQESRLQGSSAEATDESDMLAKLGDDEPSN